MPKAKTIKKLPIRDEVKQTHVSKTLPFKPNNLTNSEGYGREQFYRKPKSAYEELEAENERLKEEIEILEQACNECEGNIHKN